MAVAATELSPELIQPPICSARTAADPASKRFCTVTPIGKGRNTVKIDLTAQSGYDYLIERMDHVGDLTTGSYNLYISNLSHRTNQQLRVLTFLSRVDTPT